MSAGIVRDGRCSLLGLLLTVIMNIALIEQSSSRDPVALRNSEWSHFLVDMGQ